MKAGILAVILLWLIFACKKESGNPNVSEVFNYNNLSGILAFSRSRGKIVILNCDKKTDTTITIQDEAPIWDASVSLSSDGEYIVYSACYDEGYQVFKISINGSTNKKLTRSYATVEHHLCPVWSSNDDNIYYVNNSLIIPGPVFRIKPDGTDLKQITSFDVFRRISVSNDNNLIIYASPGLNPGINLYSVQDESVKKLKTYDYNLMAYSPVLSPDEKKIAFVLRHGPNEHGNSPYFFRILTMDVDGSNEEVVTELPFVSYVSDTYVSWSPDGKKLAFNYGAGEINGEIGSHIFIINSDGTSLVQITKNTDFDGAPSWISPR